MLRDLAISDTCTRERPMWPTDCSKLSRPARIQLPPSARMLSSREFAQDCWTPWHSAPSTPAKRRALQLCLAPSFDHVTSLGVAGAITVGGLDRQKAEGSGSQAQAAGHTKLAWWSCSCKVDGRLSRLPDRTDGTAVKTNKDHQSSWNQRLKHKRGTKKKDINRYQNMCDSYQNGKGTSWYLLVPYRNTSQSIILVFLCFVECILYFLFQAIAFSFCVLAGRGIRWSNWALLFS